MLRSARRNLLLALLLDDSLILIMRTDPNPDEVRSILDCQRPVMRPSPHGPQLADLFEA
jgi:hypothetical protein